MAKRTSVAAWHDKYNRWQINVQKDGVRRSFYSTSPGRKGQRECHEKADKWLDDNIQDENIKVKKLFEAWIDELKITTGKGHCTLYDGFGRNWIIPNIGNIKIGNLNEQHLQNVINLAYKKGLAKKTLSNIKACMTAFVKYARKTKATNLIIENVTIPKGAKVGERTILQPNDLQVLFSLDETVLRHKITYDIFINAYRFEVITGLRPGEIIGLKWSDIDGNKITLKRSINRFNETTRGKNDNARRTFYLTELAMSIINEQREKLKELNIVSEFVFPDKYGEHVITRTYYKRWVKYRDNAEISKASPYELRHTFVSMVKSLPEGYLKQVVGHSKDMDTYGVYSHEVDGDMKKTAELIENIFAKQIKL